VLRRIGLWLFAAAVLVSPVGLLPAELRPAALKHLPGLPAPSAFVAAWAVSVAALAFVAVRRRRIAGALVATAFAFQGYLFIFALPAVDAYRTQRPFAAAVRDRLG